MASPPLPDHEERRVYALGWRVFSITCFAFMSILIKLASDAGVKLAEIVFWRQALALPAILLVLGFGAGLRSVQTMRLGAHAIRMVIGLTSMAAGFTSVVLLPVTEATVISYAAPLFATLLAVTVFSEQVGPRRIAAVICGFIGVLIVAQPSGSALNFTGMMAALIGALIVGYLSFLIRDIGRTEAPMTTTFWFAFLSTMVILPAVPFFVTSHSLNEWSLLFGIGTLGALAQIGLTTSLKYASVSTVVGMDYISLIWATLADWLIWSHTPKGTTWIGAAIIAASGIYIVLRERKLQIARQN